jgi:hypothetical protein
MEDRVIKHAQPLAWLNDGVLAKHVATYQAFLGKKQICAANQAQLPVLRRTPCTLDGQCRPLDEAASRARTSP